MRNDELAFKVREILYNRAVTCPIGVWVEIIIFEITDLLVFDQVSPDWFAPCHWSGWVHDRPLPCHSLVKFPGIGFEFVPGDRGKYHIQYVV